MAFVIDDILAAVAAAAIQAGTQAAVQQAVPKHGMKQPGDVPQMDNKSVDFNALVGQRAQQQQLPKLSLQNRLPPPKPLY